MDNIKSYLQKRIEHASNKVDQLKNEHGNNPNKTHNYFGGKSLGYWSGLLTAYTNALDRIEEVEEVTE